MKKVIFIIAGVLVMMAGGASFLVIAQQAKTFVPHYKVPGYPQPYYQNLAQQCDSKTSPGCCLASVDAMQSNQYQLASQGICPVGFRVDMMKCMGSFRWCEPIQDSTAATVTSTKPGSVNATSTLLTIKTIGGECRYGECSSKTIIKKDGIYSTETGDGKIKSGNLDVNAVMNLETLIESSNFSTILSAPFNGECPTHYDGREFIYNFQTSHGEEIIDSCQTKIDSSSPLFKEIENILNRT